MEEFTAKTLNDQTKRAIWKACLSSASANSTKNADDLAIDLIRAYSIIFSENVFDSNPYREVYQKRFLHRMAESARLKKLSNKSH